MTETLQKTLAYTFSEPSLLARALTHSSAQSKGEDNERLEFLGDRVLGLAIADLLYDAFPEEEEGSLAKRHTGLVQQATLVQIAQGLDLASHLKLSAGEMKSGGQQKEKIIADALEALIGAIYLDSGYAAAFVFVERHWRKILQQQTDPPEDAKSKLQEWAQGRALPLPLYTLTQKSGVDHAPIFEVEVSVQGVGATTASAASKRAAEKQAAVLMLQKIGIKL